MLEGHIGLVLIVDGSWVRDGIPRLFVRIEKERLFRSRSLGMKHGQKSENKSGEKASGVSHVILAHHLD